MASGKGGPMLLLLSGRLVGSGVWWGWHWNWFPLLQGGGGEMFESGISQEVTGRRGYAFPEQSHLSEMRFAEQLLGHELMGIYFNDRLKGF